MKHSILPLLLLLATDDATISDFIVSDVSLLRNRTTMLSGTCFSHTGSFSIALADTWTDGVTMTW